MRMSTFLRTSTLFATIVVSLGACAQGAMLATGLAAKGGSMALTGGLDRPHEGITDEERMAGFQRCSDSWRAPATRFRAGTPKPTHDAQCAQRWGVENPHQPVWPTGMPGAPSS